MLQDRLKWNERYLKAEYPKEPATIVKENVKPVCGKRAFDIAAGNGRNALFLADQGFVVDAIDIADKGLALFSGKHPGIRTICADLDHYEIAANRYDLIVNIKFLNRRLFPGMESGLTPGGVLIFETLLDVSDPGQDPPEQTDYYLHQNELLHAFQSLNIIRYRETENKLKDEVTWLASLIATKPVAQ